MVYNKPQSPQFFKAIKVRNFLDLGITIIKNLRDSIIVKMVSLHLLPVKNRNANSSFR